jgi:hypothetical protein
MGTAQRMFLPWFYYPILDFTVQFLLQASESEEEGDDGASARTAIMREEWTSVPLHSPSGPDAAHYPSLSNLPDRIDEVC